MGDSHLRDGVQLQGGKYRIVRFLGQGGFGCTYEAHFEMLNARMAIKEFFPQEMCNRDATGHVSTPTDGNRERVDKMRRKFVDEARTLYKYKDIDGIVKVADIFEENGTAYFVMDFIDGRSVQNIIDSRGRLPEAEALRIIDKVGHALQAVHALGSLHLDIKPDNIMMGADGQPVLIDFGVSKQFSEEDGCNTSTLMGYTPGYAPIEQTKGNVRSFSASTDVYALGATLYAMLTGKRPPEASDLLNDVEELSFPADISAETRRAIEAAMEPKVKSRPQSVADFLTMLPLAGGSVQDHRGKNFREEHSRNSSQSTQVSGQERGRNSSQSDTQLMGSGKKTNGGSKKRLWIALAAVAAAIAVIVSWKLLSPSGIVKVATYDKDNNYKAYTLKEWESLGDAQRFALAPVGVELSASGQQFIVGMANPDNGRDQKWEDRDAFGVGIDIPGLRNIKYESEAKQDFDGRSNTDIILAYGREHGVNFPAAVAASQAVPGHGNWYLPASGQLWLIHKNLDAINKVLAKIGGIIIGDAWYWSSTEADASYAWYVGMSDNFLPATMKSEPCCVRPVASVPSTAN